MEKTIFLSKLKHNAEKVDSLPKKLMPNYVLIKPHLAHEESRSGIKLLGDPDMTSGLSELSEGEEMNMADHAPRYGEVVNICDELYFNKELYGTSSTPATLEWDTDIEVKVGDNVFFSYLYGAGGEHILYNDELYYLLSYDAVYAIKEEDHPVPINGFILFEAISEGLKSDNIILPDFLNKDKIGVGLVRYLSKPNRDYVYEKAADSIDVQEGDVCAFHGLVGNHKIYLEGKDEYFRVYDTRYFLFQRRDIGAVYQQGTIDVQNTKSSNK